MINNKFPIKLLGNYIGKGQWRLIRPFIYNSVIAGKITVPIGFVTDGASIPKFAWTLIGSPWSGKYSKCAVIHDWLYHDNTFNRKKCDDVFLEAMKSCNVPAWKRIIIYKSVRIFGWMFW